MGENLGLYVRAGTPGGTSPAGPTFLCHLTCQASSSRPEQRGHDGDARHRAQSRCPSTANDGGSASGHERGSQTPGHACEESGPW